jgi:hypothetical protein
MMKMQNGPLLSPLVTVLTFCPVLCAPCKSALAQTAPSQPEPSRAAAAAELPEDPADVNSGAQQLGGHRFIIPASFPTSFVDTYFGIRLAAEYYEAPDLPTSVGTFTPSTLGSATTLDFGLRILDWVGAFARGRFAELVGSNIPGLIFSGAGFQAGGELGGIVRLLRLEKTATQVSFRLSGAYTYGMTISVLPLVTQPIVPTVRTVIEGDLSQLIRTPLEEWEVHGDLAAAQALTKFFSLQAYLGGGIGGARIEPWDVRARGRVSPSDTGGSFNGAVAFEADASPIKVPLAVLAEYALNRRASALNLLPVTSIDFLQTVSLGLYYTGRRNLQLGALGGAAVGLPRLTSDNGGLSSSPRTWLGELVLLYIW